MSTVVTQIAEELAKDTLDAMDKTGEDRLFIQVAKELAASSTTLEEAFLTAIRVRMAARRGRAFLDRFLETGYQGDKD